MIHNNMELSSYTLYITVIRAIKFAEDKIILPRQQFVYKGIINMVPEYVGNNGNEEMHLIGELCKSSYYEDPTTGLLIKEIYIPDKFAVVTHECIDASKVNILNYIQSRDMDSTKDYITKVKDTLGIDMRANYKVQRNLDKYDEDLFPVKRIKSSAYRNEE